MRLTIIPSDGAVYENGVCYSDLTWEGTPANVHALQWDNDTGWIEFNDGSPNEPIDVLPEWAINAEAAWDHANNPPPPPPPEPPTAEQNKQTAMGLLSATDWVNQPDVRNTAVSPHLVNGQAFDAYRLQVRQIAVYPVAGNLTWPTLPTEVWA
jgi:hypothetical protein